MSRVYSATMEGTNITTAGGAQDLFEIIAPADACLVLLSAFVGQTSDAGDAAAELLRVQIARSSGATGGAGGTTITGTDIEPHSSGDPDTGATITYLQTTPATVQTVIFEEAFNIQAGWFYQPIPEERITISPSGILIVHLPAAPADDIMASMRITFAEVGG